MEYIKINDREYKFVIGNGMDNIFRKSFNALTEYTFGFDFEQWYQDGYWKNQYIPYSLMDGEEVVSNVSVNIMDIEVLGKLKRYIQLGTVMTNVAYRNQGLVRVIMEKVIGEWQSKCDLIYLFANESVLNFYPKFGFTELIQYQCTKPIYKRLKDRFVKKLDMSKESDRALVYDKANTLSSIAQVSMRGNAELIMFYCTLSMKENVYYIQEYDAVVVASFIQDTVEVFGVFCSEEVSLDIILNYLADENKKNVKLYFTPKEMDSYLFSPIEGEDTLFVLGKDTKLLDDIQFMFPILSHT